MLQSKPWPGSAFPMRRDEVVRIARSAVEGESWPWEEPVLVSEERRFFFFGRHTWRVMTNTNCAGRNAHVQIDDETGTVTSKGFMPR